MSFSNQLYEKHRGSLLSDLNFYPIHICVQQSEILFLKDLGHIGVLVIDRDKNEFMGHRLGFWA